MKTVKLVSINGNYKDFELKDLSLIVEKVNKQAIFDAVIAENAGMRQGTHSTLTKAEVRGGGRKPWRQKHTGRARQGSTNNPQWVGGGRAFGPKSNRNYKIKLNKKIRKLAFRSAVTCKYNDDNLYFLTNDSRIESPSTKSVVKMLEKLELTNKKILFVLNEDNNDFIKSCNNIQKVISKNWNQVSTRDIVNSSVTIIQKDAYKNLSGVFSNGPK